MIDTKNIKATVDLRELAGTSLPDMRKESATSICGPCPKCGGDDRFVVKADGFFCRQCKPDGGDSIEFCQWLYGDTFVEACERISGGSLPSTGRAWTVAPATRPKPKRRTMNATMDDVITYSEFLRRSDVARRYLMRRGITMKTAAKFSVGSRVSVFLPGSRQTRPAICFPWIDRAGELAAVRYRFLETHQYTDRNGDRRTENKTAELGSQFSENFFGWHAIEGPGRRDALVITEGEMNALSLWQAANGCIDVLSAGSETALQTKLPGELIELAAEYKHVLVWADKRDVANSAAKSIHGAWAISPGDSDANDLLQGGVLQDGLVDIFERMGADVPIKELRTNDLHEAWAYYDRHWMKYDLKFRAAAGDGECVVSHKG